MNFIQIGLVLTVSVAMIQSCSSGKSSGDAKAPAAANQSSNGSNTGGKAGNNQENTGSNTGNNQESETDNTDEESAEESPLYAAFDGQSPIHYYWTGDKVSVSDPSIAKVEPINITFPKAKLEEQIAAAKLEDPKFPEAEARASCGLTIKGALITPLKAGKVIIDSEDMGFKERREMIITAYTPAQMATGKTRYTSGGTTGPKRACSSCHGLGTNGAPAHELGGVVVYPDSVWRQWVTTGKLVDGNNTREASVPHSWTFASEEEKEATIAYVRSIQISDIDTFAEGYFGECVSMFFGETETESE